MSAATPEAAVVSPEAPQPSPDDVVIILGTRPEAIKLAGVARQLGPSARVVHTGQHYDAELWRNVLGDLAGVEVSAHLSTGGRSRGAQIGYAITELTGYLSSYPARAVVVQGDTNSTVAGAIAASALGIPVVHVEAGLRSHDRSMPEEINRIVVDAIADLCCAPVAANAEQLRAEAVTDDRIVITGNTLIDALDTLTSEPETTTELLSRHGVEPGGYVLATVHRAGTVDDRERLTPVLQALGELAQRTPVLLPLHPHTAKNVELWNLWPDLGAVTVLAPLPPSEFMALEAAAALLVSDSGGVQEEACFFRRPLVVLRDSTERPELLDRWCRLVGSDDPRTVIAQAWQDLPSWQAELATKPLPYPGEAASSDIVRAIDARWPPASPAGR